MPLPAESSKQPTQRIDSQVPSPAPENLDELHTHPDVPSINDSRNTSKHPPKKSVPLPALQEDAIEPSPSPNNASIKEVKVPCASINKDGTPCQRIATHDTLCFTHTRSVTRRSTETNKSTPEASSLSAKNSAPEAILRVAKKSKQVEAPPAAAFVERTTVLVSKRAAIPKVSVCLHAASTRALH